jgi:hypothetical protein
MMRLRGVFLEEYSLFQTPQEPPGLGLLLGLMETTSNSGLGAAWAAAVGAMAAVHPAKRSRGVAKVLSMSFLSGQGEGS